MRSQVQQARQQFREHLPSTIAKQFSREIEAHEWTAMFQMAKADVAVLGDKALELLTDKAKRGNEITRLEDFLKSQDPKHFDLIKAKSQQLAHFMMTGEAGTNLLVNAKAITLLPLEKTAPRRTVPGAAFVEAVDQLVTHYAIESLDKNTAKSLSSLVQSEAKGMKFVSSYLIGQRTDELSKAKGMAELNAYKGYVPSLQQEGVSLVIADDKNAPDLLARSYQRLGDYTGSRLEPNRAKRGYYFAPVSDRSGFNQGIMQNVRMTSGGVDVSTGFTEAKTAGTITHPGIVSQIAQRIQREGKTNESLLPVFNDQGRVVAFERAADPKMLKGLNQDTHLARMLGVWRGRQVEEHCATLRLIRKSR